MATGFTVQLQVRVFTFSSGLVPLQLSTEDLLSLALWPGTTSLIKLEVKFSDATHQMSRCIQNRLQFRDKIMPHPEYRTPPSRFQWRQCCGSVQRQLLR